MNILLVDADSTIPNIPLMKLSAYHKQKGDKITLVRVQLPYYPYRKKKLFTVPKNYDKVYCSVIFDGNKQYIKGKNIIFGGTGVTLHKDLPKYIEKLPPDYSLYPSNNISYGFITRGCSRNCSFCKVPEKEGNVHKVNDVKDIVFHKKVKFLDNNILAYPEHGKILEELASRKTIRCQFNQGLDIRLITQENASLLDQLNWIGEYIFAFDNWKYKRVIERKLSLLSWAKPYQLKFFVFVHPSMKLSETIKRISFLKEHKCLPYVMRDISCWKSPNSYFFTDLAAYCNQPNIFKKLDFVSFLEKRHTKKERIITSKRLYTSNT